MNKKILTLALVLTTLTSVSAFAEDHVMAAAKSQKEEQSAPKTLSLSLTEAQDYAVKSNRSLRNASLAVQEAYAKRWQTIASMLPSVDLGWNFNDMFGYKMELGPMTMEMPNSSSLSLTASVGINGQAIVGALLNTLAIDMQKLALEQNENTLRSSVITSYASVLVLQDVVSLLDSSLVNIEKLADMTQNSVDLGVAEQTTADQIRVRVNALKNNINQNKRSILLATNMLKTVLDVPVETELTLTTGLDEMLSPEQLLQLLATDFNISNNLNYQLLGKNVELAEKNVHMAAWAYGPTVGVGYQYSNQHYYGEGGFRSTPPNALSVSISMPLWSSGKRAAGVVEKKIALEEARNTFDETCDNLDIQNQQLRFDLQSAYETYLNEKENIEVVNRVFASTTNKFQYGATSNLELVNASNDVISAQSTYVQAVLTLVNAQVKLVEFLNVK